jgi:hypothetical protein
MLSVKKCVAVASALAMAGLMTTIVVPRPVSGAQPQPVLVTNTGSQQVPVSIASLPAMSGTVAATQSGTWTFGLSGTPSVTIANLPAAPLPVRDVDASNRIELYVFEASEQNVPGLNLVFDPLPPGNILLDHVSYFCVTDGSPLFYASLSPRGDNTIFDVLPIPAGIPLDASRMTYSANTPVSLSMSGGSPYIQFSTVSTSSRIDCRATVSGHRLP